MSGSASARQRADVERFAFAAAIAFPDLWPEAGLGAEHFRTELVASAVDAFGRCAMRTTDGRMSVAEIASRAGVSTEALKPHLQAQVYSADQARSWWAKLLDLATVDAVTSAVRAALAEPLDESDAAGTLLAKIEQAVRSFAGETADQETTTLLEVTSDYVNERCAELLSGRRRGVVTGLSIFDEWAGGLNAGELTTIVAAGGVGKSTIAMDIARRAARGGTTVLYWSAEMTARQLGQREAHAALGRAISDRSVSAVDLRSGAEEVENSVHGARIRFAFGSRPTAAKIHARARQVQHSEGLGLVILDHLGCFDAELRGNPSEQDQIARAVQSLKDIAKMIDVPFVALHHLNRAGLIRGSERVQNTSDNVVEMKRDGDNFAALTEARLLKARQTGETHKAMLLGYSLKWQTFTEVEETTPSRAPEQGGSWNRSRSNGPSHAGHGETPPWAS